MADLVVQKICKQYPTRDKPLVVLQNVSLRLTAGENVAILGPSGSGKSTLLHIIGALDPPTSGTVTLHGDNPFELSEPHLASFRSRNIGFVFQDHHLLPQLSVMENVLVPALANGRPSKETVDRAADLIERVGLKERSDHRPSELSGGERQRVAVARAMIQGPALLLADEPTGSLDNKTASEIGDLLLTMQEQEKAMLIVVTHSTDLADKLQKRMEINDGKLKNR